MSDETPTKKPVTIKPKPVEAPPETEESKKLTAATKRLRDIRKFQEEFLGKNGMNPILYNKLVLVPLEQMINTNRRAEAIEIILDTKVETEPKATKLPGVGWGNNLSALQNNPRATKG